MLRIGRISAIFIILATLGTSVALATQLITIDTFKGLKRNPTPNKIEDGSHAKLDNGYIKDGNLHVVKGRTKLNATANADTTVNMLCYYENGSGSIKKLVVRETDEIVTYDTDGTGRTQIVASLADEAGDCVQIGDNMYFNSSTDGLFVFDGTAASAITAVSAPSSVDFSAASEVGAMTPGQDALLVARVESVSVSAGDSHLTGTSSCVEAGAFIAVIEDTSGTDKVDVACSTTGGAACNASSTSSGACRATNETDNFFCACAWVKDCATTSTYQYKVTHYNNTIGIESEPSTVDSVTLEGADVASSFKTGVVTTYGTSTTCTGTSSSSRFEGTDVLVQASDRETSTTGTLASAPSDPFNVFRIYRTVAGGEDYFLLGEKDTGTYTDGKVDVSLSTPLDTSIDTITPPSFRYIEEYKGVIFTAEGSTIRFSHAPVDTFTDIDKYWLKTDKIETGAIKPLTGLHTTSNSLLMFTSNRILALSSFGAASFDLRTIVENVGTVADETIETDLNGDIIFFAGVQGVYKLRLGRQQTDSQTGAVVGDPNQALVRISSPDMDEVFRGQDSQIVLDPADYTTAHAYYDLDNNLYFLYIDEQAFIYDNDNGSWTHMPGTEFGHSVFRKSPNSAGKGVLMDDLGYFYDNWETYQNGVTSGTVTGSPTSSTATTLTDTGASFLATNDGLEGVWVIVDNGTILQYRRITANTSTELTVATWTTNPTTADDYFVGYIVFDLLTKQYSFGKVPQESMNQAIWLVHEKSDASQVIEITNFSDKSTTTISDKTVDLTDNFADKVGSQFRGKWLQWGLRSFVYNTSNTISVPVNLISYNFRGTIYGED